MELPRILECYQENGSMPIIRNDGLEEWDELLCG